MFNNGSFTHPQQWAMPNGSQAQPSMPQSLNQHGVSMGHGNLYSAMSGGGVMNGAGTFMAHGSNGNRNQLHNSGGGARVMPNRGPTGMGSMPAPALPPGGGSTSFQDNMMLPHTQARRQEILNERTKAAHQRRQEQEERQKKEQALTASDSLDLFAKPERVKHEDVTAQQASQVLGSFSNAKRIINSQTSCIGIDYQPPTPAPAQQHIIGEEDDDDNISDNRDANGPSRSMPAPSSAGHKVARRPPATIPPPPTGGHRLPPEQMNMTHRPSMAHKPYSRQQHPFGTSSHNHQHQLQQQQQQQHQQQQQQQQQQQLLQQQQQQQALAPQNKRAQMPSHQSSPSVPSGMPMGHNPARPGSNGSSTSSNLNGSMPAPASTSSGSFFGNRTKEMPPQLSKLQMPEERDKEKSVSEILQEVQTGVMPTPIQALFTPVVTKHEGNNARCEPRYFGVVSAPHFGNDDDLDDLVSPLSPIKSSKLPFSSNAKPTNSQESNTSMSQAKKVPSSSSSNRNLNLSEDSDSDAEMPSESRHKPAVSSNAPAAASPSVLQPTPAMKSAAAAAALTKTQPIQAAETAPAVSSGQDSQVNKEEGSQKKTNHGNDSSSDSSDSDSSSDEDAEDSKESSSDHDEVNPMDNDATFGLANILAKVKSTHSPGPNPHPSPKVTQTTPSAKPLIEDDMDIDGLLSQTIQPLPDINLGVVGSDLLGGLHPPLSPLPDDDDDDEDDEDEDPLDRPLLSPLKKDPLPPLPPKGSHSSRRRSSSIRNSSSYRELSDDDEDQQPQRPPPQRKHRKSKSSNIRQPMLSPAVPVLQVPPPAPTRVKPSPKPSAGRPGSTKRRISLSTTSVMLSSDSEPDEAHPPAKIPTSSTSSSSTAPLKPAVEIATESPRSVSSDKSASKKSSSNHRPLRASAGDHDESNSPVTNNTSKVKSRAMSRIFMSRSKSTTGTGGKGGKGGKGGITVERKTVPDAGDAANSSDGGEVKSYPAPIWGANGRPSILCQIPLNLLPADVDFRVNLYNQHRQHHHHHHLHHQQHQHHRPHLQTPQQTSHSKRKRSRRQSGESVSSSASSKHSFRSTTSSKSSSHKRNKQPYPSESATPHKRVKLDETPTSTSGSSSSMTLATTSAPKIDFPGPASTNHIPSAKVEPMSNPSPSDAHSKPKATVAPTPNNNSGVSGNGGSNAPWPNKMMPPPSKVFFSYLEKNRDEEDEQEEDYNAYMMEAKKLKHEADREPDQGRQAMIYLKAVLFFSLCGNYNENKGDKVSGFTMYKETLNLIRHVFRPFRNSEFGNFDNKLAVLSLRCQSLLYLKLYKLRRHELKECQKIIGDHIQKATASQQNSPVGTNGNSSGNTGNGAGGANAISPTPSPAGSEGSVCSKSSGYTSSGEVTNSSTGRYTGVLTPPTNPPPCLSVPQSVMQKQHQYCNYVSQCHELWEMADLYAQRGQCEDFIINLDRMCGPLTLHSSLKDLVNYTRIGLDYLSKEPLSTSTY